VFVHVRFPASSSTMCIASLRSQTSIHIPEE
jgi:hypothetical protein